MKNRTEELRKEIEKSKIECHGLDFEPKKHFLYCKNHLLKAELTGRQEMAKEIFDYFDKFACIKNDKWYLELKEKLK